jgi:hypothetical protein
LLTFRRWNHSGEKHLAAFVCAGPEFLARGGWGAERRWPVYLPEYPW